MLSSDFDWAIFAGLPYDHLLRGRTGALADELVNRDFFSYYFEIPPASIFQYFKDKIYHQHGFFNFLFPPTRFQPKLVIIGQPPYFPAARFETDSLRRIIQNRLYPKLLRDWRAVAESRNQSIVMLVATPWWSEIVAKFKEEAKFNFLIYDCIDDIRVLCRENQFGYYNKLHQQLVRKADLILISAQRLRGDIMKIRPDAPIEFLPNGVNFDFFIENGFAAPRPTDLRDIPRPIIGFVGSLFSWIDVNLIEAAAKEFPNGSIVLVGPVREINLPKLPNIHLLGPKPFSQIPGYVNHFDVCITPFVAGTISDKVDPIKVYEYLSLGKPVVACNLPELEKMAHLIYLTDCEQDFTQGIRQALAEKDDQLKEKRMAYARDNSWRTRVTKLLAIIDDRLKER